LRVQDGDRVSVGEQLTEGSLNPNRILRVLGREAAQVYLLEEVHKVYRSQGVPINDKHIEVIIRQMTNKIQIVASGDSDYLAGELLDNQKFQLINQNLMAEGKRPASGRPVLLGITKAALSTESFLSASSFQHTINVLAQAAIEGKRDDLFGLKENVILGKLIPAGTGYLHYYPERVAAEQTNGEDGQEPSAENGSEGPSAESPSAESPSAEGEELPDVTVSTDGDGTGEVAVNV
jgi:DNA-directed RNA polymerase subunit beta'